MGNCYHNQNAEYGSEFHLMDYEIESINESPWQLNECLYMGSGRDAIRLLLSYGIEHRGWLRLWVPGYFCQEVVESILSTSITVMVYENNPFEMRDEWGDLPFRAGDVIFLVNYFGFGNQPDFAGIDRKCVEVIEDHTHDPWSEWAGNSQAEWCLASLRKTMPVPDGGVLWSPQGLSLPDEVDFTIERKNASLDKLAGMVLKKYYLEDLPVQKQVFRDLFIRGEESIASGEISAMSPWSKELLKTFPIDNWRKTRIRNYLRLVDIVKSCESLKVPVANPGEKCPLSVPLLFDTSARRDYVRERLIEHSVYPAILWELDNALVEGISPATIDISRRILSIHCDMRYNEQDMDYIANLIVSFINEFGGNS